MSKNRDSNIEKGLDILNKRCLLKIYSKTVKLTSTSRFSSQRGRFSFSVRILRRLLRLGRLLMMANMLLLLHHLLPAPRVLRRLLFFLLLTRPSRSKRSHVKVNYFWPITATTYLRMFVLLLTWLAGVAWRVVATAAAFLTNFTALLGADLRNFSISGSSLSELSSCWGCAFDDDDVLIDFFNAAAFWRRFPTSDPSRKYTTYVKKADSKKNWRIWVGVVCVFTWAFSWTFPRLVDAVIRAVTFVSFSFRRCRGWQHRFSQFRYGRTQFRTV